MSPSPAGRCRGGCGAGALAVLLAVAWTPAAALAEMTDREKPINYSADTGDVNYQTKVGTLTGNVIITQGTLSIRADKIVFKQNPDNSMSASAFGNPVAFRQKRDGYDEYFEGYAQHAEYDGAKQFLELFDHALLKRGQDEIRSNYITYNATTELFKAETRQPSVPAPAESPAAARVRGVFQPKSDSPIGLPGAKDGTKDKDAAKDGAKAAPPKAAAPSPTAAPDPAPATLKPAPELTPPSAK